MFCVFSFFFFSWFDSKINYRVIPYVNGFNFSFFLALLSANRNMSRVLKVPWSNYSLSIVLKQVKTTVRTLYINISLLQSVGVCQTAIDKGPLGTRFFVFFYYYLNVIWNLQPSKQVRIFAQRRRWHHRWSEAVIWNRHQSSVKLHYLALNSSFSSMQRKWDARESSQFLRHLWWAASGLCDFSDGWWALLCYCDC